MVNLALPLAEEKVWLNKSRYDEAEKRYYERLAKLQSGGGETSTANGSVKSDSSPKKKRKRNASKGSPGTVDQKPVYNAVVEAVVEVSVQPGKKPTDSATDKKLPCQGGQKSESKDSKKESGKRDKKETEKVLPKTNEVPELESTKIVLEPKEAQNENKNVCEKPQQIIATEEKRKKEKKKAKINKKERRPSQREEKGSNTPFSLDSLADEVAKARQHIKSSLDCIDDIAMIASNTNGTENSNRINQLEKDNKDLKSQVSDLNALIKKLESRISALEISKGTGAKLVAKEEKEPAKVEDDDDVDLFGSESDDEDEAAQKIKEQRLAEYAAKKSKKPALIAKSNIILDVKPWDDETDMKVMEQEVRKITCDGLIWGASKLVPLAYGIHKLQISCVVEDDKVSVDWLTETIEEIEDYVQSVDIAAFNKV